MASAARRSSRRLLEPCSRTLAPAVTRPWPAVLFRTRLRPFHASPIRCALNIAQHDIFEAMGVRTDPSVARLVDRVTDDGFGVAGITVKGPVIVVGGKVFLWDVPQYGKGGPPTSEKEGERIEGAGLFEGWTAGMLQIFELLEQPPEILVFGTGAEFSPLPNLLRRKLHMLGIQTEVQKTRTASSTYNVLISEGRQAAAALLPIIPTSARTGQKLEIFEQKPSSA